ncbi:RNA-binding protein [Microcoleus sp. AT9_B5]
MDSQSWEQIKLKYRLGQFLLGKVEYHAPFGVFVNIGEDSVKGLIKIPDFLDNGEMSEEMYPEIGSAIGAIIVGYNESNCREVYLSAKPSVLHEILVPLRSRPVLV